MSLPQRVPAVEPADRAPSVLKGPIYRKRKNRIENLRLIVQLFSLAVVLWIGIEFYFWTRGLELGRATGVRPPGVEGFLPISALISLRYLLITGQASRVHPAGMIIFVLIVANGLLLKRSFCSWVCPVGTISESLSTISQKLFRRRLRLPRVLDYSLRSLKYLLLGFFLFAVFVQMAPEDVGHFLRSPYNKIADIKMLYFFTHLSPFDSKVILGLLLLSIVVPYFWCRYLCPYGALLAGLSLLSPVKIKRRPISCIDCGLCAKACPSGLKVDQVTTVRSDECTGCLSCVASCPVPEALQMDLPGRRQRAVRPVVFALLVVALFYGGIEVAKRSGFWRTEITPSEFQRRFHEINDPKYSHFRGQVPDYGPND